MNPVAALPGKLLQLLGVTNTETPESFDLSIEEEVFLTGMNRMDWIKVFAVLVNQCFFHHEDLEGA